MDYTDILNFMLESTDIPSEPKVETTNDVTGSCFESQFDLGATDDDLLAYQKLEWLDNALRTPQPPREIKEQPREQCNNVGCYDKVMTSVEESESHSICEEESSPKKKRNYKTANCPVCKKTFFRKYEMTRHLKATHLRLKPFDCPACPKYFARKSHLILHWNNIHKATLSPLSHYKDL